MTVNTYDLLCTAVLNALRSNAYIAANANGYYAQYPPRDAARPYIVINNINTLPALAAERTLARISVTVSVYDSVVDDERDRCASVGDLIADELLVALDNAVLQAAPEVTFALTAESRKMRIERGIACHDCIFMVTIER